LLASTLGLTLGVLGAGWLVHKAVIGPIEAVRKQIAEERGRRSDLKRRLIELEGVEQDWKSQVALTLASEPKEAQLRFRENMQRLLERHGLAAGTQDKGAKISPGAMITDNRTGFVDVPLNIQTSGALRAIVAFLADFYRQGYAARIDQVTLTADTREAAAAPGGRTVSRTSRRTRPGATPAAAPAAPAASFGPDGPPINVTIDVVTFVAPRVGKIDARSAEAPQEQETGRLRFPAETYQEIAEKSLFWPPYAAPPAPAVVAEPNAPKPAEPAPEPVAQNQPPPQPTRNQPERQLLIGTTVVNGVPHAYVLDERDGGNQVRKYGHDETLDGEDNAVVLLIHPRGLVVRATDSSGRQADYFYPLRQPEPASFAERTPLSEAQHPEIVAALRAEFIEPEQ
jgi:hypothetical protein